MSQAERSMSSPWWDARTPPRWRVRGGLASDLAGGSLLLATWVLLWAFFVIAVMGPAAELHRPGKAAPAVEEVATAGPTSRG